MRLRLEKGSRSVSAEDFPQHQSLFFNTKMLLCSFDKPGIVSNPGDTKNIVLQGSGVPSLGKQSNIFGKQKEQKCQCQRVLHSFIKAFPIHKPFKSREIRISEKVYFLWFTCRNVRERIQNSRHSLILSRLRTPVIPQLHGCC